MLNQRHLAATDADLVLLDRPKTHRLWFYYIVGGVSSIMFAFFSIQGFGVDLIPLVVLLLMGYGSLIVRLHVRLTSSVYRVTRTYVEIERGIFGSYSRKIPLAYVRDVTASSWPDQQMFGLGSITVTATNGDSITLEDITDYEAKKEIIWKLVSECAGSP